MNISLPKTLLSHAVFGVFALAGVGLCGAQAIADDKASDKADAEATVTAAVQTLKDFSADPDMSWYRDNVARAKAVMVVPQLVKAGFIFGGSGGNGVVLVRDEAKKKWMGPSFTTVGSVSWGLQAGGSVAEVVMMAMTDKGKDALLSDKFQAGADVSVAAGPVGAGAQAATTDILQFSRSKGIFGGLSLEGSVVAVREGLNEAYYGAPATPVDILVLGKVSNPQSKPLIQTLTARAGK
jgi:Uncharacterized conserved protein